MFVLSTWQLFGVSQETTGKYLIELKAISQCWCSLGFQNGSVCQLFNSGNILIRDQEPGTPGSFRSHHNWQNLIHEVFILHVLRQERECEAWLSLVTLTSSSPSWICFLSETVLRSICKQSSRHLYLIFSFFFKILMFKHAAGLQMCGKYVHHTSIYYGDNIEKVVILYQTMHGFNFSKFSATVNSVSGTKTKTCSAVVFFTYNKSA